MIIKSFINNWLKEYKYHIAGIFVLSFLFRLGLVWYLLGLDWQYTTGDGYENAVFLEHLLKKNCYMPPGQYLFAGLINQFFPQPNYLLLRIATILLSALVSVNIYRIGRENFGHRVGIISGYTSIVSLTFIYHSWTFYATTLATCLFSFFILYVFRMLQFPGRKNCILAGVFLGLSALTRAEMLIFLPITFLWIVGIKGRRRNNLKSVFTMMGIAVLVISCWTVRNYLICNKYVLVSSNAPVNFFIANNPLQREGYFPPKASKKERENYLLAGLTYDLEHPGWFVNFLKEKFKLYWSTRTGDHPKQLLESRFDKSAIRLFNDKYEKSRLNRIIQNHSMGTLYEILIFSYSNTVGIFWIFIFIGLVFVHLFWQKGYFLIAICFTNALVFLFFLSVAHRCCVPMLPYLYIIMGIGVTSTYRVPYLMRTGIKTLIFRNSFLLLMILVSYSFSSLLMYYPGEKKETIRDLHDWNILSIGKESVRLIILESQLSYPVKEDSLTSNSFSVWVGGKEIPHFKMAGKKENDEKYYFKKVKNLLCKNAFVINLPHRLMNIFLAERKSGDEKVTAGEIVKTLNSKVTVCYIPAWQFRSWIENVIQQFLRLLQELY